MLAEDALDDVSDRPELHENITGIRNAAERAAALVRQILTFSREEVSADDGCDMTQAVDAAVRLLANTLPASLRLTSDMAKTPLPVELSASDIDRIVLNLVTNARDAMDGKGNVAVTVQRAEIDHVLPPARDQLSPGVYARLTVTDDGPGMPPATCERIFEPFFTTKSVEKGGGMGLSVLHGIVTTHGGAVFVETAPGLGTRFDVFLPLTSSPEEGTAGDA